MRQRRISDFLGAPRPPNRRALSHARLANLLFRKFKKRYTDAQLDAFGDVQEPLHAMIEHGATPEYLNFVRASRLIKCINAAELAYLVDSRAILNANDFDREATAHGLRNRSLLEYVFPSAAKMRVLLKRGADPTFTDTPSHATLVDRLVAEEQIAPSRTGTDVLRALFKFGAVADEMLLFSATLRFGYFSCVTSTIIRQLSRQRDLVRRKQRIVLRSRLWSVFFAIKLRVWARRVRERAWLPGSCNVQALETRFKRARSSTLFCTRSIAGRRRRSAPHAANFACAPSSTRRARVR